jgi:hypothetical protein
MNRRSLISLLALCLAVAQARAAVDNPLTRLLDTGGASAQPLAEGAMAGQSGWNLVPEDTTHHVFSGDAVLMNDKLAVVLRQHGTGAEVYARTAAGLTFRAEVRHSRPSSATQPAEALKIVENSSGAVVLERGPARFRLTTGESILELRSADPAGFFNVRSCTRYVVVPDYFGDDMVFAPEANQNVSLPAENFCLNLIEGGDAMLMTVWQSNQQQVWLGETSGKSQPGGCTHRISCLPDKTIWLAFLETPGLWQAQIGSKNTNFKPAFPAKWRCSLMRQGGLAESWDLERRPHLGQPGDAAAREPASPTAQDRPLIIYPIDRSTATPLTVSCPTDVTRNTLGVGPCQYILACEGLAAQGDPTPNAVMNWVEKQFEKKQQRKAADEIKERLALMVEHVAQARTRIDHYAEFAGQIRKVLANKPGAAPYKLILDDLDRFVAAGRGPEAAPERAIQLAQEAESLTTKEAALPECRRIGGQLRELSAIQDGTLARCRMAMRRLRQQAVTFTTNHPQNAGPAAEVQRLADQLLVKK